jgi:hypothetical protein
MPPLYPLVYRSTLGDRGDTLSRRTDVIDRPREYAAAGVPFYLRVDFRNRIPALVLSRLAGGGYQPVVVAAARETFAMTDPFEFAMDPASLLDDEA